MRHTSERMWMLLLGGILLLPAGCGIEADNSTSSTLRYKFKVGQELVYRVTSDETFTDSGEPEQKDYGSECEWHVFPIRRDEAGTWRLLISRSTKSFRWPGKEREGNLAYWIRRGIREGGIPKIDEPEITFQNEFMGYCDLQPDGTFEMNDSLGSNSDFKLQPEELFCQMPRNDQELRSGWKYDSTLSDEHYDFSPVKAVGTHSGNATTKLIGKVTSPEDSNYGMQVSRTFTFDPQEGIITRIDREGSYKYRGEVSRFHHTVELVSREEHDDKWVATFSKHADDYMMMNRRWWNVLSHCDMARTGASCEQSLAELRTSLEDFRSRATLPEFRELHTARLRLHDREAATAVEEAAEREAIYARPSVDWETTDFENRPQNLLDYRGKVVVLDFWYRGCVHCIRALPKVSTLR